MGKRLLILSFVLLALAGGSRAHNLEPLHVDGRYLKNPQGDIVTLHGLMMAVEDFWCEEGAYWTGDDYEGAVKYEKQWVDSVLTLDWKIDYIRLQIGAGWIENRTTNHYDLEYFKQKVFFDRVYIPIIDYMNSKGIYAVLYYDGIRFGDDLYHIGDKAQQYALEFWDYISSHPHIKNNPGVMMELYNEPVTMVGSDGRINNYKDVKNYFQPMVDVIRQNGCNCVVWIPGLDAQSQFSGYATNPIEGENIGYAIHAYWILNSWDNEITPVSNMAPCMITETGWSNDINNNKDQTSTFGNPLKHDIDRMGNVSWNPLVDDQGVYLKVNQPSPDGSLTIYNDPEAYIVPTWNWFKEYADSKTISPSQLKAVSVEIEDAPTSAFPGESRAMKLMAKFENGKSWNVAGDAIWASSDESVLSIDRGNIYVKKAGLSTIHGTYTDGTGQTFEVQFDVVSSMFPLTSAGVNYFERNFPNQFDEATKSFSGVGFGGWRWTDGIDLSAYQYLVLRFTEKTNWPTSVRLKAAMSEEEIDVDISNQTEAVINLQQVEGLDLTCVKMILLFTQGNTVSINEMFLSNDGVTPAEPPVVRPWGYADDKSMTYGDEVPELTYSIVGTTPSQAPVLSTTATKASPVGTYEITIAGSDDGVDYQPGTLQVLPAQLTVTAGDVVIGAGMDIPALTLTYEGFRNGDTEATALSEKPTVTTTATKDSPCGNYEISVIGGSAANYDMVCYGGTLTITPNLTIALPADRTSHVGTSQEDWQAWGVCSTEYAPAVTTADGRTAPMVERYEQTVETIGTVMEQTVTGLEDGDYTLVLCANAYYTDGRGFDSDLTEGATDVVCLHANDVTVPMTAHIGTATAKNDEYTLEVTVTGGTLHISMEKLKAGTNWHTLQIKSLTLTKLLSLQEAYARALAEAEELLPQKMSVYAKKDLQQTIAAEHTYANYFRLAEAVKQGRKSVDALAFAARALAVMKNEMLTATNVCTPEAAEKFLQFYQLNEKLYEEDWLTTEKAIDFYNPYEGGNGVGYWEIAELLSSAWEIAGVEEPPYGVGWVVISDDGFAPPYMSYDAPEGSPTLEARTLTATMIGMEPGEYTLSAFVRLRAVDGDEAPKGINMQLCDGEAVSLSGERFRDWNEYLGHYTARGTVGDDGVLTVRFIVAEDNNISQLAFRDLWIDNGTAVKANDLTMNYGDAVPELTYTASGDLAGGAPELSTIATSASPVGTYPITVKPGTVGNRFVRYTDGTLTILPAPLTITADDKTKKQGDAMPELTATYKGFKNDETHEMLTKQPTLGCTATAESAPGTYPITVQGATAQNYDITFVDGTLTVTEADAVIVTANSCTIEYGDDMPEFGYTVEGAELNGKPHISCTAQKGSPVGTYDIVITKGSVENYNVTYVAGTLTITKAPLTVGVEDAAITEGEELPAFKLTYDGFKNNDTEATAFTSMPTATTTATTASAPGEYPITVRGGEATNYELSYTGGTLTIEASPLPQDEDLTARVGTAQEDWHAWGVCATDYAPAITTSDGRQAQMMETYEENVETVGEMMYQEVSGLDNGDYAVELYANAQYTDGRGFASDLKDGATDVAYVSANDRRCYVTAHVGTAVSENGVYTVYAQVTDGTLRLGLTAEKTGTNWHTLQIRKLTLLRQGTVIYADDKVREQGSRNPTFTYTMSGAGVTGRPLLQCTATKESAAGSYVISVSRGTTRSDQPIYLQHGVLTVTVPSGIGAIESDGSGEEPVYDLQGRRVEGVLKPGLYIRDGKAVTIEKKH